MNRRTSPPDRCACRRAPSSFHSTDAKPVAASADSTSLDGLASIGNTGRLGSNAIGVECVAPTGQGHRRRSEEIAGHHRCPPDRRDRNIGGGGDRRRHHAVERALTQLATDDAVEQSLLPLRRPAQERGQPFLPEAGRARAGRDGDGRERVGHLRHGQRRGLCGSDSRTRQRRPSDTDPAIGDRPGHEGDRCCRLVRFHTPQHRGECGDLGVAFRCRSDQFRCLGEVVEECCHSPILAGLRRDGTSPTATCCAVVRRALRWISQGSGNGAGVNRTTSGDGPSGHPGG